MERVQIELPILLPDILDEKDRCIQRLVEHLRGRPGIEKVHVKEGHPARLCIHYQPDLISLNQVRALAQQSGAGVTQRFRHRLLQVKNIRHQRHARRVEEALQKLKGVVEAAVSATGVIRLEWDRQQTSEAEILRVIEKSGLKLVDPMEGSREKEHGNEKHDHAHGGFLGENTELYFAIGSGVFWLLGLILSFVDAVPSWLPVSLFVTAIFLGGYFTLLEAVETIRKGKFEIDFLMLVAAAGAAALGKWEEGALLLFLFSLGHALEAYAMNKARKSIAALSDLAPDVALVRRGGKEIEVPVEELKRGDVIVVKPHTKIAADGVIVSGSGDVNQAPITGESMPVDKVAVEDPNANYKLEALPPENRAFAGTINGSKALEVKVLRAAQDSTLSRLIELVREAETQKSPTQHLTDRFERYFVPAVLVLVILLLFAFVVLDETFAESFYRAMAVLVAASPCALAISTPSAVLAGVARAARQGVLVKGGRPLEDLGSLTAVAFDKTGTLTEGRPKLTHVIPFDGLSKEELLTVVLAVEKLSDHPLAAAIVEGAEEVLGKNPDIPKAQDMEALTARGVRAVFDGAVVHIGNRRLFEELTGRAVPEEISRKMAELEEEGNTAMIVHRDGRHLGIISVMDLPRQGARETLQALEKIGIRRMIMLTGDNQRVANAIAKMIGITDPMGDLLPEDKVAAIEKLKAEEGKVAMVGDGVNDAPAMAKSTVGIAMGAAGSDLALETADVALMADKLDNLPFAIGLSRKARGIIRQNLWISLGMVAVLIPLTIMNWVGIGSAVIFHEGSTLVVVFNALRLLAYKKKRA